MIPQKQISVIKMSQKILSCKFCGEIFKEARYLERHLMSNKNCRRFRGVLFVCLGCNAFHTTSINEWDAHRELCNSHTTTTEVFQRYQQEISDLKAKLEIMREMVPCSEHLPESQVHVPKKEDVLTETFGENISSDMNIEEMFNEKFDELKPLAKFSKHLRTIKSLRMQVFRKGNTQEYLTVLQQCHRRLTEYFASKNYTKRKIQKQILQHFTALDLRFLRSDSYEKLQPDGSSLKDLDVALSFAKHPTIFHMEWIRSRINESTIGLFPLRKTISRILCQSEPTYIYFGDPSSDDPFEFYQLCKIDEQDKHHWRMDCRAQSLVLELRELCTQVITKSFKEHYYHLFNDNVFRENFLEHSLGLQDEFLMLLKNMKLVRDIKHFSQFCQQLVISKNVRPKAKRDIVNLTQIDPVQELLADEKSDKVYRSLFDQIDETQTELLMSF